MEENKYEYNPEEGYDYEREENEAIKKSLRGYRVVIILLAIILAGLSVLYFNLNRQQQQTETTGSGGWWSGLWSNASNIVDSGGRHTAAAVTSLGNAISSVIATSKSDGNAVFSEYGYSDRPVNYGPYVLGGAFVIAAGVLAAIVLTRK